MKKILFFILILKLSILSFAEIKIKINQPIRFKNINTKAYGDLIIGQGSIEVFSTDFENDYGKKIKFKFPKEGLMTNKKRWLKVEKFKMEENDEEFEVLQEKKIVNFYAFIRRSSLNKNEKEAELIEGEYIGYTPIIVEQYGKPINHTPTILPAFPDKENKPTFLPIFPDFKKNN